jgi:hypothetical protein
MRTLNHVCARICSLAHARAVLGHENYIAHAYCGDSLYVSSKFRYTPSKDERTLNDARARIRARCIEHEKYIVHATSGDS